MEQRFHVLWEIVVPDQPLTRSDIKDKGACDAVLIASVVRLPNGVDSIWFQSVDGITRKELTNVDIYKIWISLTSFLVRSIKVNNKIKSMLELVLKIVEK